MQITQSPSIWVFKTYKKNTESMWQSEENCIYLPQQNKTIQFKKKRKPTEFD